jgi:hypothetical protein
MPTSRLFYHSCFLILLTLLSSCSGTHQAYLRTLKLAFDESKDIVLKNSDITQSTADLIYVKKGDSPTVVLALAFIEDGQYKWISADKIALIEQNGRLIKTIDLEQNLDFVSSETEDPLIHLANVNNDASWFRQIDFANSHFGVPVNSIFANKGLRHLSIQELSIETILIEEQVTVTQSVNHLFSEYEWQNQFWVSKTSGKIIRSRQKITPNSEYFDITYVSRVLRL